jgi:hypothetical protein
MPTGLSVGAALALGAAGSTLLSGMMAPDKGSGGMAAAAPEVTPPTPIPDDKAIAAAAKQRSIVSQQQRRGRASTILSDQSAVADPLGG